MPNIPTSFFYNVLLTIFPFVAHVGLEQIRLQVGQAVAAPPSDDSVHASQDGSGVRRGEGAGEERLLSQPEQRLHEDSALPVAIRPEVKNTLNEENSRLATFLA